MEHLRKFRERLLRPRPPQQPSPNAPPTTAEIEQMERQAKAMLEAKERKEAEERKKLGS